MAMDGDIRWGEAAMGIQWVETKEVAKYPTNAWDQPPFHKDLPSPKVNSVEAKKPWVNTNQQFNYRNF